jgi:hypothetical protein
MRRLLSLLLALSLPAVLVGADDAPKPNTLTPQEIADGWLLLFDGETTFGWKIDGEAKVERGELVLGGTKRTTAELTMLFGDAEVLVERVLGDSAQVFFGSSSFTTAESPNSTLRFTVDVSSPQSIRLQVEAGKTARIQGIKLKPRNTKPLFNGKDLTGWKKFEGNEKQAKSQFSVTPEGWLHIKNGPGDLQTEGQYADFLLQLECRTNGNRLNSGVFFRCRPGEYQQGYEAQIHNGWADKPKDYVVEEYDPKTNEPKEKTKVPSAALDYGTGAIYRRIPARKAVAKDNEWFTMTVVAQGRHISTWVNGVQVVDWMDNRPLRDNARNGCRLEKGNISLQGHDPTTDLSFRNFRIAERAPEKKDQ